MPIDWLVSQISQPVRILLIGAVVFLAAWFTVLRPKSETVPPPTTSTTTTPVASATPQTGLGKAVDAAKKAAGVKPEGTATATPATGTATTSAPETKPENTPIAAVPAEELAKLPGDRRRRAEGAQGARARRPLEDAKPWRPLADDDRYVRNALKRTNRYDGGVVVKTIGLDQLSNYGALVNDLGVTQSPSIVVIDRNLKGTVLTGYVDRIAINQAIADARRVSITPNITDSYLRQANAVCGDSDLSIGRWSRPTIPGDKAADQVAQAARGARRHVRPQHHEAARAGQVALAAQRLAQERQGLRACPKRVVTASKSGSPRSSTPPSTRTPRVQREAEPAFNQAGVTNCTITRTS